ncbi:14110_t:CDS:2 [Cetraspora pellucida]|uniref:14110_t:CDS:1 n=1 Tax=Cetraspora pellucida TaxID=1433469 RepID=A0A9N9G9G3_9GLOM|nr:14110_t:CDS:2 [Cetraspora pellucida]
MIEVSAYSLRIRSVTAAMKVSDAARLYLKAVGTVDFKTESQLLDK